MIENKSVSLFSNLKSDIPAGLVVFLVALPLCLGIALASGAPLSSGLLAGVIGGLLVPLVSRSPLSVCGPAAGLTAIVFAGIEDFGGVDGFIGFEGFLVAIFFAGLLQVFLGIIKLGNIAYFVPSSVIKGMMAGIGLILILKQLPHAIGYDVEAFGFDHFLTKEKSQDENTFSLLLHSLSHIEWGALIISALSLPIMVYWGKTKVGKIKWLPAALVATILGVALNQAYHLFIPELALQGGEEGHLVNVPQLIGGEGFLRMPDWSVLSKPLLVLKVALTVGVVASLESLLTVEAVDKLDPLKRKSPLNRELMAQGLGNMAAGLLGAIPMTSVVVRSSASVNAGGRTRMTTISHALFLLLSILFLVSRLNMIPLASLASILLVVGYKLANPDLWKKLGRQGMSQLAPAVVTTGAILFTDLLTGISVGIVVGLFFVFKANYQAPFTVTRKKGEALIRFNKDVSFINKAKITNTLENLENGTVVIIDGGNAQFIDHDILEELKEFEIESENNDMQVKFINIPALQTMEV